MWLDEQLVSALRVGDVSTMRRLIRQGAHDHPRKFTPNLLFWSARAASPPLLADLLAGGANPNQRDPEGETLLHVALGTEPTRILVEKGADLEALAPDGATPLHRAVETGDIPKVLYLISAGALLSRPNSVGDLPVHLAVTEVNPSVAGGPGGSTTVESVEMAPQIKRRELLEILKKAGADLSAPDRSGATPLHLALRSKQHFVARFLASVPVRCDVRDSTGKSPRDLAADLKAEIPLELRTLLSRQPVPVGNSKKP